MEVILVLALMVTLATMAAVSMRGGFAQQRLRKAADQVRIGWGKARIDAIKSGRVQVFYYGVQSNRYFHTAQASMDDPTPDPNLMGDSSTTGGVQGFGGSDSQSQQDPFLQTKIVEKRLADGVQFIAADVRIDQRSAVMQSQTNGPSDFQTSVAINRPKNGFDEESFTEVRWGTPVYFYPDGSSSSAQIILQNESQKVISVYLRGLTGIAQVGEIKDQLNAATNPMPSGALR